MSETKTITWKCAECGEDKPCILISVQYAEARPDVIPAECCPFVGRADFRIVNDGGVAVSKEANDG